VPATKDKISPDALDFFRSFQKNLKMFLRNNRSQAKKKNLNP
jgi:hypothetical protein